MEQKLNNLLRDLINIFLLSWYCVTRQYIYPLSILPKKKYVRSIDIDLLSVGAIHYLVRRSNKQTVNATFTDSGTLQADAIISDDVPGMSMNLLGGKFKQRHIAYIPKRTGMHDWEGGKIYFVDYKDEFETTEKPIPIFFVLSELHNAEFPYHRTSDKEANKIVQKLNLSLDLVNGKLKFFGSIRIKHAPTNLNYWHVELTLFDQEEKIIKNTKKAWSEDAATMALDHVLTGAASATIPSKFKKIDTCYYVLTSKR